MKYLILRLKNDDTTLNYSIDVKNLGQFIVQLNGNGIGQYQSMDECLVRINEVVTDLRIDQKRILGLQMIEDSDMYELDLSLEVIMHRVLDMEVRCICIYKKIDGNYLVRRHFIPSSGYSGLLYKKPLEYVLSQWRDYSIYYQK